MTPADFRRTRLRAARTVGLSPCVPHQAERKRQFASVRSGGSRTLTWLSVGLGAAVVLMALTSPLASVRRVDLHGAVGVSAKELAQATEVCRLPRGANIFLTSPRNLAQRLEAMPWVEAASAARTFSLGISIQIVARKSVAAYMAPAGTVEIDRHRVAVRRAAAGTLLPNIEIVPQREAAVGKTVAEPMLDDVLEVLRSVGAIRGVTVRKIVVDNGGDMCLNINDDLGILLGSVDELSAKLAALRQVLGKDPRLGLDLVTVDVRNPRAVTCRPRSMPRRKVSYLLAVGRFQTI